MIGDMQDMIARMKAVLPRGWFADSTPVLDGLLTGMSEAWTWIYQQVQVVRAQARIATANGLFLDIIASDFFGAALQRLPSETDDALRTRIQREMFRPRATRDAVIAVVQDITGQRPLVFEPARPADVGGYVVAGGYSVTGGWGNLGLPFQCFITAYRPLGAGIASVAGWATPSGGYGIGSIEYVSLSMIQGPVTDDAIFRAIAAVLPAATVGWTRITN